MITTGTTPPPTTTPPPSGDPVLVGAGDIANSGTGDTATANLLDNIPGAVFTAGDNAYDSGTATEFATYYDPTWGRRKARTRPAPGNHDYNTPGATGYYDYFGANAGPSGQGYYSYDLGSWHVVSLNSEVNMAVGSPQEQWLRSDLAASTKPCTIAYWHKPRFTSGANHAPDTSTGPLVQAFGTIMPNSEARNSDAFGVLKFTLHAGSYDWQFVPEAGKTYSDSGTTSCH
ncbi:metallophosphoesterase family protein [Streptomyces sp. NPDC001340]